MEPIMPIIVGDTFRHTWVGSVFNQRTMFTMDYAVKAVSGSIADLTLQDALLTLWSDDGVGSKLALYAKCLSTSWGSSQAWVQEVHTDRLRKSVQNIAVTGSAGAGEVTNLSAGLTLRTLYSGRKQVATKKLGPLSTDITLVDAGLLTAAYNDLILEFADALTTEFTALGGTVTMSPIISHGRPNYLYDVVNNYVVGASVRVNRRRTVGLGE